jgi:tryptophan synthase alpha chain
VLFRSAFAALSRAGEKGLVVYLTAGDPGKAASLGYLRAAADGGADILELGVPFSDPMADGPTIQQASRRALNAGMTAAGAIDLVSEFRKSHGTPVVLFGYFNPFLRRGVRRLCRDARQAGVDGLLVVDLPLEESGEMAPEARAAGLDWIALASPTSGEARIRRAADTGTGFLYLISVTGITGARNSLPPNIASWTREVKSLTALPVAVGFGISNPGMARAAARHADAAVVGSACVKIAEAHGVSPAGPASLRRFVRTLKNALR